MLRLDQMQIDDQQQSAEAPGPAAAADHQQPAPESQKAASEGRKAKLVPFSSQLKADDWLLETDWGGIDGAGAHKGPAALLLDLSDAQLSFEVLRGTEVEAFANAAATILPALPKVPLSPCAIIDSKNDHTSSTCAAILRPKKRFILLHIPSKNNCATCAQQVR